MTGNGRINSGSLNSYKLISDCQTIANVLRQDCQNKLNIFVIFDTKDKTEEIDTEDITSMELKWNNMMLRKLKTCLCCLAVFDSPGRTLQAGYVYFDHNTQ